MATKTSSPAGKKALFPPGPDVPLGRRAHRIFAVGGGKGGVGKSLITANIAYEVARAGHRTVLVDADLGCPNLHTCLGLRGTRSTLSDFLKGRATTLQDIASDTGCENLRLISGARDSLAAPNITFFEKNKIIDHVRALESEYVFMDLSAGTSYNTLDFFLAADVGVLIVLPEPASVENLYRMVKALIHRRLSQVSKDKEALAVLNEAEQTGGAPGLNFTSSILDSLREKLPAAADEMEEALRGLQLRLIVNQVRRGEDRDLGETISRVVRMHLGLRMPFLGAVDYDPAVSECMQAGKVLSQDYPETPPAQAIREIAAQLMS